MRLTPASTRGGTQLVLLTFCVVSLAGCDRARSPEQLRAEAGEHWPFLDKYCVDCHNKIDLTADIAFDSMSPGAIADDAETWERAVRQLRGGLMPPTGGARPGGREVDGFVAWMEASLDETQSAVAHPGRVELHRLNRTEYTRAIEELLGLEVDPGVLPIDDLHDGFDNMAKALQVSPSFIEQYLDAARALTAKAVGNPTPRPVGTTYAAGGAREQRFHVDGLPLGTRGGAVFEHYFPSDGDYLLNIGNLIAGTHRPGQESVHTVIAVLDGKKLFELEIGGGEDSRRLDQERAPAVEDVNSRLKNIPFTTTAGVHRLGVTFLERSFAESDRVLPSLVAGDGQEAVMTLNSIEIFGPVVPAGLSMTRSRERIFVCYPNDETEYTPCAKDIVANMAHKAFRGVSSDEDMPNFMRLYELGAKDGGFEEGVKYALSGVFAHPKFLYRFEPTPEDLAPGAAYALGSVEIASRLSFFLWSSIPDAELLEIAAANRLSDRKVLEQQVERMLADPRSETLASNFAYQWLGLSKLNSLPPDQFVFGDVDGKIRDYFVEEAWRFVDSVFREDRNVIDLLTAGHTYLNEPLARHYGINDVRGMRFRRVELEDEVRFGLLGKGAVLLTSSYPNRTSPVLRGAWLLERIVGTPPPEPPPNVEALAENVDGEVAATVRQRLEAHRENPSCGTCHNVIDPLGYALENFDAVGRWRVKDREAGTPIDSSGVLANGTVVDGPLALRQALLERPDRFVQTVTERLMTYALGRPLEYRDMPAVRRIVRQAADENYRFSAIVWGIVTSDQFLMQGTPSPDEIGTLTAHAADE
jgi:hypothetical protein